MGALSRDNAYASQTQVAPILPTVPVLEPVEIALALEHHWFELWCQPQLNLTTGRIYGVEALLRLRHPDLGILGPESFIQPAEDHQLIRPLTDFVLQEAVYWCAMWRRAKRDLTVSLNLSKAGLDDRLLPDLAATLCAAHGIPPGQIMFELTESSLAADRAGALDILTRLRLKHLRTSLDDFGMGGSSLDELRELPVHELKLDRQFLHAAGQSDRALESLGHSVKLATEMGWTTVAVGVETEAMLQLVITMGCQAAQGFLLARPMPADELLGWLSLDAQRQWSVETPAAGLSAPSATPWRASSPQELVDVLLRFARDAASPLTVVLGVSEGLLDDSSLTAEQRADVTAVQSAAQEVTSLLKALQRRVREQQSTGGAT